jgi:hypothetical protein
MRKLLFPVLVSSIATLLLTTILQPLSFLQSFAQQSGCRTFPETGKSVCGVFLSFWERNGGLVIFGYPISSEFTMYLDSGAGNAAHVIQYFERAGFQMQLGEGSPRVQLALVGTTAYKTTFPLGNKEGDIPTLPSARNVNVSTGPTWAIRTTTFDTSDRSQVILSYYKDKLTAAGWQLIRMESAFLAMEYDLHNNPRYDLYYTGYTLSVTITAIEANLNRVQLIFTRKLCC